MRAFSIGLVGVFVAGGALAAQGPLAGSAAVSRVGVVGTDYAYSQLPDTVAAGPTIFSFENRGTVRHEMSVILLKPDVTLKQILDRPGSATSRAVAESL